MRQAVTRQASAVHDGPASAAPLADLRFRALLPDDDWARLPPAVRRRFSRRLADGKTVVYVGQVREIWLSRAGWLIAQAARLIGAPLPLSRDCFVPSVVTVTEDMAHGGQIWTRLYARRRGFPQIIHSSKRFAGATGLEEHIGFGFGMALTVHVEDGVLVFRSKRYFLEIARRQLPLPGWASPGDLSVSHAELGEGRFLFTLELKHPRLGLLIRQAAAFREQPS
jgi:hypothetical protein